MLIDSAPDLEVVGEASDGTEAVELARTQRPHVVLMDIQMPAWTGSRRAGASGFLLKDTPPADLLAGIRIVAAWDAPLAPSVTRQLIGEFARRPEGDRPPPATLDVLTDRECEVLTLVARGWSNAEIAERLHLSAATAKTLGRLLMKLQARDRTPLVVIAYETGLVTPGAPPSR